MSNKFMRILMAGLAVCVTTCTTATRSNRPAPRTALRVLEAGLTPTQEKQLTKNCSEFGQPKTDPEWPFGPTRLVVREGYALQHSTVDKIAIWVCEHIGKQQLEGDAERRDPFRPDPLLPVGQRSELTDYKSSGYARGHQAPAANQAESQELNDETFYLSNMAPQNGSHNSGIWARLEGRVRDWVKNGDLDEAKVITGGMFYDPKEESETTADGVINYVQVGANKVSVPTHFYKIVLGKPPGGEWQAIAFVIENKKPPAGAQHDGYIKSIDWIEERTGLNFFPDLDPAQEAALEGTEPAMWFE